ncbi:hypothetical protein KSP24_19435 [Paenibacillus sp. AK121]|uniref:DUF2161 domain-containing phosphodiesterase n=1 Tax=Paenibacillus TaxID=44249 RepID=UPI0007E9C7B9|nr:MULTISPECIES: DUF2161 family putative PD-(D/E)XK-type phosphodiesterase [Paenibacillus]MBU9709081.1 hypothetical protein [Paenibacillus sp. AK121]MEE4566623.1 DUF2161 family putative PD-(D/E)XK-type phosphodiesterase [Paenibacillus polymyxa]OAZ42009.1 hypothetical protein A9Z39_05100 [Paenibacillus polymyxa]
MAVRHETELYAPVKAFFENLGYEVKGEVRNCDLVGIKPGQQTPLIVEIKKTFNLALVLQGMQRLKLSSNVYVAVERNRAKKGAVNQRWNELIGLCRQLGLGLLTVTHFKTKPPLVEVLCKPVASSDDVYKTTAIRRGSRKEKLLREFHARSGDHNIGGSTRRKLVTAYREKALRVAAALQGMEEAAPAQLARTAAVSDAAAVLQRNYYGWFERVARGRYRLTPFGEAALSEYAEVLQQQGIETSAGMAAEFNESSEQLQIADASVGYSTIVAEAEDD